MNIRRLVFIIIFILIALGLSVTAAADFTETEIFDEDIIVAEDHPNEQSSDPVTMHDIEEVGMPEIPAVERILMQWEKEGYPDDIGGIYFDSEFNTYGILVVNPSPQRISELLELLDNDVIITPCIYSYNELMQVQNEITEMMVANPEGGIFSSGIGWGNVNNAGRGFGESGKEFRVSISVDASVFDHYNTGFTNRYGDRVIVSIGSPGIALDDMDGGVVPEGTGSPATGITIIPIEITGTFIGSTSSSSSSAGGNNNIRLWIVTVIAMLCTIAVFIRFRLLPAPVKQTINGDIITKNVPLTKKQIISAVKKSGNEPREEVYKSLMKRIDNV